MKMIAVLGAFALLAAGMAIAAGGTAASEKQRKLLVHAVYFDLKDDSATAQQQFVELCDKYLDGHEGTVYYAAGPRAEQFDREVNDQDFGVSLYVVFESQAAHDKYQVHPRHLKFIEEGKDRWKRVRVFDSHVPATEG